jgi:nitrogen fixation/metabolism regulation signal transduction histidine kinase
MEEQLGQRKELIQSKKLALSNARVGVAHELNNPLNNIYTTAQRLLKKTGEDSPDYIKKGLADIFGQTMRVKSIVGDLLELARGREPHAMAVELLGLIRGAYSHLEGSKDLKAVQFSVEMKPEEIVLYADTEQLEWHSSTFFECYVRCPTGALTVKAVEEDSVVNISVTDTGWHVPGHL